MATAVAPWLQRPPDAAAPGAVAPTAAAPALAARGVRPIALVHAVVALLFFSNLGRLPALWLLGHELPILPQELVLLAALAVAAVACAQRQRLHVDGVVGAAALFALIGAGAAVATAVRISLGVGDLAYSLAYLGRWVAYTALYLAIINVGRGDDGERLWATVERTILAFAVFGLVQAALIPAFAQKVYPTTGETLSWDYQGYRLVSTVLDPNFAGILIVLPLLVHVGQLAFGVRVPLWKPLVLVGAVLATASRSSLFALAVGGLVVLAARGLRRRLARLIVVSVAATLPFLPLLYVLAEKHEKFSVTDDSALARLITWARAITVFADHPVFGIGFNTYGFVVDSYGWSSVGRDAFGLDGGLLFIAVLTGVVGLLVFLVMLGAVVRRCRRLWRDPDATPLARGTALGVAAGVPALCAHSIFTNSLLLPWVVELSAVLWGMVFLMSRAPAAAKARPAALLRLRGLRA